MRRAVLALLPLGVIWGCATAQSTPPEIRYLPPTDSSVRASEIRIPQSDRFVWKHLLDRLQQPPLTVELADRQAGLIVSRYRGDPEPYVECGWIMAYGPQDTVRTPGARAEATFGWRDRDEWLNVRRSLDLSGRMVVRVRSAGAATLLAVDSTYVVTKALQTENPSGELEGHTYEIVSFTTDEQGRFAKGTICQPTGELERVALDAATAGGARGVAAAPASALDCAAADAAYCEARDLIAPFEEANRRWELGLALRIVGGSTLFEGQQLALDIDFPNYDSFLHVAYIQRSGLVGHILPGHGQIWPARAAHYVERTGYDIAPPYGVETILALATEQPLFATPRPAFEPAEAFLAALRQGLAELTARNPGTRIAASQVLVTTEPRSPTATASF